MSDGSAFPNFLFPFFFNGLRKEQAGAKHTHTVQKFYIQEWRREVGGTGAEKRGVGGACEVAELCIVLELFLHTVRVSHPLWL